MTKVAHYVQGCGSGRDVLPALPGKGFWPRRLCSSRPDLDLLYLNVDGTVLLSLRSLVLYWAFENTKESLRRTPRYPWNPLDFNDTGESFLVSTFKLGLYQLFTVYLN